MFLFTREMNELVKVNQAKLFPSTVKPVLSGPHIKRTPSELLSVHQLESLNFLPTFTVKKNLGSADTSVIKADMDTNINPFCCIKPAISR